MTEKTTETPPMIEEKSPTKIQTHQEEHKEESEWHQKAKIFNHLLRLFRYLDFRTRSIWVKKSHRSTGVSKCCVPVPNFLVQTKSWIASSAAPKYFETCRQGKNYFDLPKIFGSWLKHIFSNHRMYKESLHNEKRWLFL